MGLLADLITEEDLLNFFDNSISVILNGKVLDLQNSSKEDFKNATLKMHSNLLNEPLYLKNYFIQDANKKIEKFTIHNYFRIQLRINEKTSALLKKHIKPGFIAAHENEKSPEFTDFMKAYQLHKKSDESGLISFNLNLGNKFNANALYKEYTCKMEIRNRTEDKPSPSNSSSSSGWAKNTLNLSSLSTKGSSDNLIIFLNHNALFDGFEDPLYLKLVKYNNLICQYLYLSLITDNAAQEHLTDYLKSAKHALRKDSKENFTVGQDEKDILNMMFDMSKEKFEYVEKINNYMPKDVYSTDLFLYNYEQKKKGLEVNPIKSAKFKR